MCAWLLRGSRATLNSLTTRKMEHVGSDRGSLDNECIMPSLLSRWRSCPYRGAEHRTIPVAFHRNRLQILFCSSHCVSRRQDTGGLYQGAISWDGAAFAFLARRQSCQIDYTLLVPMETLAFYPWNRDKIEPICYPPYLSLLAREFWCIRLFHFVYWLQP